MPQILALGARWAPWEVLGDFSTSGLEPSLQWLRYNIRRLLASGGAELRWIYTEPFPTHHPLPQVQRCACGDFI